MTELPREPSRWLEGRRVGVSLSSGFFGFFAHLGFLRALGRLGVTPVAMAGCSAGALVGAMAASGMDDAAIGRRLLAIRPWDLVDPPGLADLRRGPAGLVQGGRIERDLAEALPASTFEDCRIPLAVTAFDLEARRLRSIASGPLAPAVRASVSMPGMFCPARLDGRPHWDGGIVEKVPLEFLAGRGDLDAIVVCYLGSSRAERAPGSILGGVRAALDSHIVEAGRRAVGEARGRGLEVWVVAPAVPRCGPHRLGLGASIVAEAEAETLRIVESRAFGCEELS